MRTATCVLIAYVILLLVGAIWRSLPWIVPQMRPEVAAIVAAYLGLTARRSLAGAVGASIIVGYLADLLGGGPVGLYALVGGLVCILAYLVQRRLLVRGWSATFVFALIAGLTSALMVQLLRAFFADPMAPLGTELTRLLGAGVATALIGPPILAMFRRVDAAFARTHRERDAALEGLAP